MQIQMVDDRGYRKVNILGVFFCGLLYRSDKPFSETTFLLEKNNNFTILSGCLNLVWSLPVFTMGTVKSIWLSRDCVTVILAIAKSAVCIKM